MQAELLEGIERMEKAIQNLEKEFGKLRTGRASTTLLDDINVDYYGSPTPINQLASVTVPDSRTLTVQPWDKGSFPLIEKAIQQSDLGLNPVNDGKVIRISMPPLTEDRRKDLAKMAKKYAEESKVAVRNIRRDVIEAYKKMLKAKESTEDDMHGGQDDAQKETDKHIAKIDELLAAKEKEIMEI